MDYLDFTANVFMHFFSIEFRANIFILMDIMIFHIIIQKNISLVFVYTLDVISNLTFIKEFVIMTSNK